MVIMEDNHETLEVTSTNGTSSPAGKTEIIRTTTSDVPVPCVRGGGCDESQMGTMAPVVLVDPPVCVVTPPLHIST